MKRPATKIVVASIAAGVAIIALAAARHATETPCGAGFRHAGARCIAAPPCPAPLVATPRGCDAPDPATADVPETTLTLGASDWEAEGRVKARTLHVAPFRIDRFEVTRGRFTGASDDAARAASGVTLAEARAFCAGRGGRLPTEDEWIAAAAGDRGRRYPWGDTGAVCRRAAWGLVSGPCAEKADGPDTAGAHPDGDSPLGVHDLAGNVAEWVESDAGVVRGGSYTTSLATDLRTWVRQEVKPDAREPWIGFRCAYDATAPRGAP